MEITRRYRVNVGTSTKGVKSFDCTVEVTNTGETLDDSDPKVSEQKGLQSLILAESDALVAELDKRYPPPIDPASVLKPLKD